MEILKSVGYAALAIIGLCAALGVAVILALVGATIGSFVLGIVIVLFVAVGIKEYFEGSSGTRDT